MIILPISNQKNIQMNNTIDNRISKAKQQIKDDYNSEMPLSMQLVKDSFVFKIKVMNDNMSNLIIKQDETYNERDASADATNELEEIARDMLDLQKDQKQLESNRRLQEYDPLATSSDKNKHSTVNI